MNVKTIDLDQIEDLQRDLIQEKIILVSIQNDFKTLVMQFNKTLDNLQEFLNAVTKK